MPDMLVKLYELPDITELDREMERKQIDVRRALPPEKHIIIDWVRKEFSSAWASECEVAFSNHPVSCYVAVDNGRLTGFSCYDATCRDYFGPVGVSGEARGNGIGRALLLKCLYAMEAEGYAYAIIGDVGPGEFYAKTVGATVIEGSEPGIYKGMMRENK